MSSLRNDPPRKDNGLSYLRVTGDRVKHAARTIPVAMATGTSLAIATHSRSERGSRGRLDDNFYLAG